MPTSAKPQDLRSIEPSDVPLHPLRNRVPRILVADDHAVIRAGMRRLLEAYPDFEVVGEAANGEEAQHNVGIAEKAEYNSDTGDIILTGWPRVSQGINTQIATSKDTVMIMNKDGHTMKTKGPSRTTIQEQQQDQSKKGGKGAASSATSPQ